MEDFHLDSLLADWATASALPLFQAEAIRSAVLRSLPAHNTSWWTSLFTPIKAQPRHWNPSLRLS